MYEVGQEVRMLEDYHCYKKGVIYPITSVHGDTYRLDNTNTHVCSFRFEPIGPKFKEGETVRVIGNKGVPHLLELGAIGEVIGVLHDGCYDVRGIVDKGEFVWNRGIEEQDLELVTPQEGECLRIRLPKEYQSKEDVMRKKVVSVFVIDNDENVSDDDSIVKGDAVYVTRDSDEIIRHKMTEVLKGGILAEYNKKRIKFKDDKGDALEKVSIKDLEIRIIQH